MKFRILGGLWGEGWLAGDVVSIDEDAARVRLKLGEIEQVGEEVELEKVEPKETTQTETSIEELPIVATDVPFCDTCDSKGVRHKKVCPKFV